MATVRPFRGLLYSPARIPDLGRVVTPPYDVIPPDKAEQYRRRDPHNIVHMLLPRESGGLDRYRSAAALLEAWTRDGILVRDERACLYVVSQRYAVKGFGERTRFGLIARVQIEEDTARKILPHERTMDAPREDRMELLRATRANLSQIFLLYPDPDREVSGAIESVASRPAERWAADDAGVEARLWRISDPPLIARICEGYAGRTLWIADGHHRYAAARAYRDRMRAGDRSRPGTRSYDYIMACLTNMDSDGVTILPYHRVVRNRPDLDGAAFARSARQFFEVKEIAFEGDTPRAEQIRRKLLQSARLGRNVFAAYLGRGSFLLLLVRGDLDAGALFDGALEPPLRDLDVSAVHHLLLEKALGISREEQRDEEGPLRYSDDIDRAMSWVDGGEAQAALLLNPTLKEHLMSVSAAGLQMPQKSTYFYPKLLSGLVVNPHDPVEEIHAGTDLAAAAG